MRVTFSLPSSACEWMIEEGWGGVVARQRERARAKERERVREPERARDKAREGAGEKAREGATEKAEREPNGWG